MKYIFYNIIALTMLLTGCSGQRSVTTNASGLRTSMQLSNKPATKDSVLLTFTVTNTTDRTQRFCKWETPFEPRLGKYFEAVNSTGQEAEFKGAMAKRVMPPPPEAYIEVPAHNKVSTTINLADNYTLKTGKYNITYTGSGVSGLAMGNKLTVTVSL